MKSVPRPRDPFCTGSLAGVVLFFFCDEFNDFFFFFCASLLSTLLPLSDFSPCASVREKVCVCAGE